MFPNEKFLTFVWKKPFFKRKNFLYLSENTNFPNINISYTCPKKLVSLEWKNVLHLPGKANFMLL